LDAKLDKSVIALSRPVRALSPTDSAARAAGLFRASGVSSLPVVGDGRVLGVVSESSALSSVADALRSGEAASASDVPISRAIRTQSSFAHRDMTVDQIVAVFSSTEEDVLPIVDDFGGFYGVVTRSDVLGYLAESLRPANVAGMATPMGVYLTNGSVRAGVGDLGLFLSGATLAVVMLLAVVMVWGLAAAIQHLTHIPTLALVDSFPGPTPKWLNSLWWTPVVLRVVLLMALIRLSPLSGYHAAEHMTVHAMEEGEDLTPDIVRMMPRVHPRCGTNLLAGVGIFLIVAESLSPELALPIAIMVVILGWRTVGGYIQRFATTKNPNRKQLDSGLEAGKELIARFQEKPNYQAYGFARIWNTGMLQSLGGLVVVFAAATELARLLHFVPLLLGV
jgi:CBS domain-containing protein